MKTVVDEHGNLLKIGRFTVAHNRSGYHLRWWDSGAKKQQSSAVGSDLEEAKRAAHGRMAKLARPEDVIDRKEDPTFGQLWVFYAREEADVEQGQGVPS